MKPSILLFTIPLLGLFSCGSFTRIGDLTMISTRNVDSKMEYVEIRRYVKAIGKNDGDTKALEAAIDNAIKQVPGGEFLKNCTVLGCFFATG